MRDERDESFVGCLVEHCFVWLNNAPLRLFLVFLDFFGQIFVFENF